MTSPAEIIRNRCAAAGLAMTMPQAEDAVTLMRAHGWKLTPRDCGDTGDAVLEFTEQDGGGRESKLISQSPNVLWSKIWDQMA
jgi:hypothetical protein